MIPVFVGNLVVGETTFASVREGVPLHSEIIVGDEPLCIS